MNASIKGKLVLLVVRLLAWRNGLEGFLSFTALLWGVSALAFPLYWTLPCAGALSGGSVKPIHLAWVLIVTGGVGWASLVARWRYMRAQSSVIAFIVWGLMAVWSYQVPAVPVADDIAVYAAFALGELAIYVRTITGLDPVSRDSSFLLIDRRRTPGQESDDAGDH